MSWDHLERDKAEREKIAQLPCCICGKTIGSNWHGSNGRYAHRECAEHKETREPRACVQCHFVRKVKVVRHPMSNSETFEAHCDACKAELSALRHFQQAKHLSEKARKIREKRRLK